MSKDKNKPQNAKAPAGKTPVAKPVPIIVPPLFRKIDWLVLAATFAAVWATYLLTLAPELTLEDCGELCTASFYAGIPHPPGYPFWTLYSWLWTLVPFGNVAWRVELGESFAAAMACGLVGFMVSRGSSMLIEGIEELKNMDRRWENAICVVTGVVAGLMTGYDGFLWKESVVINRISPFDVPWLIIVALCLLRWIYAPHQRRYLYIGMFFFGVCATIHQTMLVAAMGIEICIAFALPRLGRDLFLGNSIIYVLGLVGMSSQKIPALNDMAPMFVGIFHVVGLGSIAAWTWMHITPWIQEKRLKQGWRTILFWSTLGIVFISLLFSFSLLVFKPAPDIQADSWQTSFYDGLLNYGGDLLNFCVKAYAVVLGIYALVCIWIGVETRTLGREWKSVLFMGLLWLVGASFYLYEPLAGMTDPPMQWGYPRTVEGFFHALSRGQYERASPTDIVHDPVRFIGQLWQQVTWLAESYSWVAIFIALLPFLFLFKMKNRERSWIIGLAGIYLCVGVLLTIIMNTPPDRAGDENRAFFTASHAVVAIMIGYGLALMAAYMATHYKNFRLWGLVGGGIGTVLALYCLVSAAGKLYFGPAGEISLFELPHWVAQAFAKDQYGLPVFANLILLAVPIIFVIALLYYRQRGPVLILLCLLMALPVWSGMTHWYKSEQRNHWFGYWFGHDMFTPPFGIYPEMSRDTILFGGTDPGRFCPTYMIFCESFIPHRCQPAEDQKFDRRDVYLITQNALADGTYLDYLRAQYNRSQQKDPPFFSEFLKYVLGIPLGPNSAFVNAISDAAYHVLDVPFTKLGANIEARRRAQGVYPPNEIYIPSPEDSQNCFQQYTEDVARRQHLNQLKPGDGDVHVDPNGRVQAVSRPGRGDDDQRPAVQGHLRP